ncbi:hypothetical protein HOH87_05415 [bacterium]|nr:hypothetical protein [bacterium]
MSGNKGVRDNGGLMGDYQNKTKLREASVEFKRHDAKTANILKNPDDHTPQERDAALQKFNEYASAEFGVTAPTSTSGYDGNALKGTQEDVAMSDGKIIKKSEKGGLYDKENKSVHINDRAQDGSTKRLVEVDGHEMKHLIDAQKKRTTTEDGANRFGDQAYDAFSDEIGEGSTGDYDKHQKWTTTHQGNGAFDRGNTLAGDARDVDACGGLCVGALMVGAGAATNLASDFYFKYNESEYKTVDEFWSSGEYSKTRGAVQLGIGAGLGLGGGVIGAVKFGGPVATTVFRTSLSVGLGAAATEISNNLLNEDNSVLIGAGTGLMGHGIGSGLNKLTKNISKTRITPIIKNLPLGLEGYKYNINPNYAVGQVGSQVASDLVSAQSIDVLNNTLKGADDD